MHGNNSIIAFNGIRRENVKTATIKLDAYNTRTKDANSKVELTYFYIRSSAKISYDRT